MISTKKILIISSEPALHSRLTKYLSERDYYITYTRSTDDELKLIIDNIIPELIVIDPEISSLKGVEISLRVRQWTPAPILILTTAKTLNNEVRALDLAAEDYLSEPFNVEVVAARISHILSLTPTSREGSC